MLETITTGGSGFHQYEWSNGFNTPTIFGLGAGIYSVTVSDNCNATAVCQVTLSAPTGLQLEASTSAASCFGDNNGSISLTGSGGTSPYMYTLSLNGSNTTGNFNNLPAGYYNVCLLYTSPSPRDRQKSRMPSSA